MFFEGFRFRVPEEGAERNEMWGSVCAEDFFSARGIYRHSYSQYPVYKFLRFWLAKIWQKLLLPKLPYLSASTDCKAIFRKLAHSLFTVCSQNFFFRNIGMAKIFFYLSEIFSGIRSRVRASRRNPALSFPFCVFVSRRKHIAFSRKRIRVKKNRSPPKVRSGVSLISTNLTLTSLLPADAFTSARKLKLCLMLKRFRRNAIPNLIYFSKNQKIVLVREPIFDTGNHALNLSDGNVQFFQRCFQNLRDARFIVKR